MEIKDILKMNPESECKISYYYTQEWNRCYYQLDEGKNLNPNDLPKLEEKYLFVDSGEHLINDDMDLVFDPKQEVLYEPSLYIEYEMIYSSKTFIKIFQKKIKELINSDDSNIDMDTDIDEADLWDELELLYHSRQFFNDLGYLLECNDFVKIEESDDNSYLWFTSTGMNVGEAVLFFEEI